MQLLVQECLNSCCRPLAGNMADQAAKSYRHMCLTHRLCNKHFEQAL